MVLSDGQKRLELVKADSLHCVIGEPLLPERRVSEGNEGNICVETGLENSF
jgi:hypothetical protein